MLKKWTIPLIFSGLLAVGCSQGYHSGLGMPSPMMSGMMSVGAMPDTARYEHYDENPIKQVSQHPLATFSLDVDTGSYANVRRFLNQGRLPNPDAVRVEEMMNYFPAEKKSTALSPLANSPFSVDYELAPSPWNADRTLLKVNVQAKDIQSSKLPAANLVFLVDVSGSMYPQERLPLIQSALKLLVDELRAQDRVSIVTYSGSTSVVLPSTSGDKKAEIRSAIDQLTSGGGTNGGAGLQLAYEQAKAGFIKGGVNRVLLATDGDFNLGITDGKELESLVKRQRESGITLSALGVGDSNFNEAMMVKIADIGNGNYSYIDSLSEAQKVLGEEMRQTLVTVAKDVKAQIEFNPDLVLEYRQIGYEKRQLKNEDFNNDAVDAGDIGAGKRVTVMYELTLVGQTPSVDALRYGSSSASGSKKANASELAFLKLRWKAPTGDKSRLASLPINVKRKASSFSAASEDMRFLSAVAAYGQKLRGSDYLSSTSWEDIARWGDEARGEDGSGYRAEFVRLVKLADKLSK